MTDQPRQRLLAIPLTSPIERTETATARFPPLIGITLAGIVRKWILFARSKGEIVNAPSAQGSRHGLI